MRGDDMFVKLMRRMRSDRGFTLAEIAVGGMLASMVFVGLSVFVISSMKTGAFTEGQSATINDVRNAMQKIEKELRGAEKVTWCAPAGSCMEVGAQTPTGSFRTIRYTHVETELLREMFDDATSTWGDPLPLVERVMNTGSQPVFACDTQSTLLRVNVDLHIEPTPASNPNLHVLTSIRPRNYPEKATCP